MDEHSRNAGCTMANMSSLDEWVARVCAELGLAAGDAEVRRVLDLARDVAHGVERPAAPVTAYLAGLAVGGGLPATEAFARIATLLPPPSLPPHSQ